MVMKFKSFTGSSFKLSSYFSHLSENDQLEFSVLTKIFPFKANQFVLDNLIDWSNIPGDPIYKLVFPRKEMIGEDNFDYLKTLQNQFPADFNTSPFLEPIRQAYKKEVAFTETGLPRRNGEYLKGMYRNFPSVLSLFPSPMVRTCHSYCNYCVRWEQFNNPQRQDLASYNDPFLPVPYLKENPEIHDVLFTGADPMVLPARTLKKYIDPILEVDSVRMIRISTKSITYWPFRFTSDPDASELLQYFKEIQSMGKHLSIMAHITHPRELSHPEVHQACRKIKATGAIIRTQAPLIKGVNDSGKIWASLWKRQLELGMVPFFMFVEAGLGIAPCFRVSLARSLEIFQEAKNANSDLVQTVRGPILLDEVIWVEIVGTVGEGKGKQFVMRVIQSPPEMGGQGEIRLIPYSDEINFTGDLQSLFVRNVSYPT